jgi:hypothetical protein
MSSIRMAGNSTSQYDPRRSNGRVGADAGRALRRRRRFARAGRAVAHGRLVVLVALGAPASIAAAALLYQLVERPFMTRPASAPAPLPTAAPAPRVGGA